MLEIDEADQQLDALAAPIAMFNQWPSTLAELRRMHAELYNLLGDPALRIALPRSGIQLSLNGDQITGHVEGMTTGHVEIRIESARTTPARAHELAPVLGPHDPDLERKATHNYPIANGRVLQRFSAEVVNGAFEVTLGEPIWASAALIKAYARGEDPSGQPTDSLGAVRLPRPDPADP